LTRTQAIDFLLYHPDKYGQMLGFDDLEEMHKEWMNLMFFAKVDKTLQAHRNSYKTTCVSINLARTMILKPRLRILFMRKTDDDVKEVIKQTKKILIHPKTAYLIQCIYGIKLNFVVDNVMELSTNLTNDVKGTSQLVGTGIQSSLTGQHYDIIFTDDIVTIKDRISRAEREQVKIVYDELQNIKMKGTGRIFNTGTPWHKDDAFTKMPKPLKYDCYSTGIFSDEEIQTLKEKMAPSLFAANYELRHISDEDVIFDGANIGADVSLIEQGLSHVDAAYWGEDTTAFTIANKHDDNYYVFGKVWNKHVDSCVDIIEMLYKKYHCGKMYNETNADKGYLAKELRTRGMKVSTYHENENKYIKITSHLKFAWKNVIFVEGTDDEYIQQILDFNENAEHDDCADSLASLIRVMDKKKSKSSYTPLWN